MANKASLVSLADRPEEERKRIAREGGLASGRAKREKASLAEKLKIMMSCKMDDGEGGKARADELIAAGLVRRAIEGNAAAVKTVFEYVEGRPLQRNEVEFTGESPIQPKQIELYLVSPDGTRRRVGDDGNETRDQAGDE